jgi:uncharacterized membrane protein YoaK (UPF0700 family)
MLDPDLWLRQQLWQQLWNGPGAVSAYLSIPILLVGAGLSPIISTDFEGPSLCILAISVLLSVFLILVDQNWLMPKSPPGIIALLCHQKPQSYWKKRSQIKRD